MSSRKDVFDAGGYRLTWVAEPHDASVLGRVEYVFRETTLDAVDRRLVEMVDRLGFSLRREIHEVVSKARSIPDDLTGLAIFDRQVTLGLSHEPDWRGKFAIFAEAPSVGDSQLRAMWMVELRVFRPDFRAASDPKETAAGSKPP